MNSTYCKNCNRPCILKARPDKDELFGAPCDLCKVVLCKNCSEICTTEAHAVALTQRVLLYYCQGCKNAVNELSRERHSLSDRLKKAELLARSKDLEIENLESEKQATCADLQKEVETLLVEIKEKDSYIKRLNRRTKDFEEEALAADESFVKKVNEQKHEILKANKEIVELMKKNGILTEVIKELEINLKGQTQKLSELDKLKVNMMTSIDTLSKENDMYAKDLKKANRDLLELREKQHIVTKGVHVQTEGIIHSQRKNGGNYMFNVRLYLGTSSRATYSTT